MHPERFGGSFQPGAQRKGDSRVQSVFAELVPFIAWMRNYRGRHMRADLVAGLTVAVVAVPQSMAYALIAGVPVQYGLYASIIPTIAACLWGSSAQLITGPTTAVSLVVFTTLAELAQPGTAHYLQLAFLLALVVGAIQIGMGLARLGVFLNFVSHSVILGFSAGAAVLIGFKQIPELPRPEARSGQLVPGLAAGHGLASAHGPSGHPGAGGAHHRGHHRGEKTAAGVAGDSYRHGGRRSAGGRFRPECPGCRRRGGDPPKPAAFSHPLAGMGGPCGPPGPRRLGHRPAGAGRGSVDFQGHCRPDPPAAQHQPGVSGPGGFQPGRGVFQRLSRQRVLHPVGRQLSGRAPGHP